MGGLLGHRIKFSCGCDDLLTDGWRSLGTVVFLRVHVQEAPNIASFVLSLFHWFFFGLRGLMSHRVALSCWCDELRTAMWR